MQTFWKGNIFSITIDLHVPFLHSGHPICCCMLSSWGETAPASVSPASLWGQWRSQASVSFEAEDCSWLSRPVMPLWWFTNSFFLITKAIQADKKSNNRELHKETFNCLLIFLPIVPSSPRSLGNELSHFPYTYLDTYIDIYGNMNNCAPIFEAPNQIIPCTLHGHLLLFTKTYIMGMFLANYIWI